jgi:type VI secretion system protein ImpA
MATPPFDVDLEKLLAPISAEAPAGVSLRYEGIYAKIQEARREDDPTLPQGVWERKLKVADHRQVMNLATEALEKRSKDLQIAIWLAEAWLDRHRFAGAAPGLELCAKLLERFWDTCFPAADDDGDARISLVDWVDDMFTRKVRLFPFTDGSGSGPVFTLEDWEASLQIDRPGARSRVPVMEDGTIATREAILARISLTGHLWWSELRRNVRPRSRRPSPSSRCSRGRCRDRPVMMRLKEALRAILSVPKTCSS